MTVGNTEGIKEGIKEGFVNEGGEEITVGVMVGLVAIVLSDGNADNRLKLGVAVVFITVGNKDGEAEGSDDGSDDGSDEGSDEGSEEGDEEYSIDMKLSTERISFGKTYVCPLPLTNIVVERSETSSR